MRQWTALTLFVGFGMIVALTAGAVAGGERAAPPRTPVAASQTAPTTQPAGECARLLRQNVSGLVLNFYFYGQTDRVPQCYTLSIRVSTTAKTYQVGWWPANLGADIAPAQALKVIDYLESSGTLARMCDAHNMRCRVCPSGMFTTLSASTPNDAQPPTVDLMEFTPWGNEILDQLDGLKAALDGEPAKAVGAVRESVATQLKQLVRERRMAEDVRR